MNNVLWRLKKNCHSWHFWLVVSTHPSEKYESQKGLVFPIYGKIKHVPNHQSDIIWYIYDSSMIIVDFQYMWKKIRCSKPPTGFVRPIHNSKRLIDPPRFPFFGGLFYGLHLLHLIFMWDGESRSSWKHDLSKMDHHILHILNIQLNPPIRSNKTNKIQ